MKKLLKKGVIKEVCHESIEYVSPIFITRKSDGGTRFILNLKQLNEYIEFKHFKMISLQDVLHLITTGCYNGFHGPKG